MGFFSASASFTRYRVTETLPDNFWNLAIECIEARSFRERARGGEEQNAGWVSIRNPFQPGISLLDISFDNYLLVSLRVDERKVPAALLKKHCAVEEARMCAEKECERLPRAVKTEIRDRVRSQLLAKVLPVPKLYDLLWDISEGTILFFSSQDKARSVVEDFFHATFGFHMVPVIPYTLALSLASSGTEAEQLEGLKAEVLA